MVRDGGGGGGNGNEEEEEEAKRRQMAESHRRKRMRQSGAATFGTLLYLCLQFWKRRRGKRRNNKAIKSIQEAPISILLAASKKGLVQKVLLNNSHISYLLDDGTKNKSTSSSVSSSSTRTRKNAQSQTWKKSTFPNQKLANDIIHILTEGGCLDISTLPEPFLTRLAPFLLTASPFVYLFFLYHMMKRLQKGQGGGIGDNNDDLEHMTTDDLESRSKSSQRITFDDVAGMDHSRMELEEIVSYLSNPIPFLGLGARPPRGVLLHGPPGCGKTLLAKAVAHEAHADYFVSCAGSDFVEVYVGQGAKRVRNLFGVARKEAAKRWRRRKDRLLYGKYYNGNGNGMIGRGVHKLMSVTNGIFGTLDADMNIESKDPDLKALSLRPPTAVVFIDEIDALAKCRDGIGHNLSFGPGNGNDEREQTLNALLTEMDGFGHGGGGDESGGRGTIGASEQVFLIVIAATNRLSIIDPAILRPGRFDRHVRIDPPDAVGREAILRVHSRNVKLEKDHGNNDTRNDNGNHHMEGVETDTLLREVAADDMTEGFTGADLANVMNEAALLAVRQRSETVKKCHISMAIDRIRVMKTSSRPSFR